MLPIIQNLTRPWEGNHQTYKQLQNFAENLGWYPSDIIENERPDGYVTGHLFVEHGLGNSAVITFINNRYRYSDLSYSQHEDLLKISYNNLVDLHISVDLERVNGFHNRYKKEEQLLYSGLIKSDVENLRSDFFEKIIAEKRLYPNIKALDDALIDTISNWKRVLSSELGNEVDNRDLSNLFNTVIFTRAVEDHYTRRSDSKEIRLGLPTFLLQKKDESLKSVFENFLNQFGIDSWPDHIIDLNTCSKFDNINKEIIYRFFNEFYFNKFAPYKYDFSIISKHALSRIYERYVSILRVETTDQLNLFGAPIPFEENKKSSGTYYTPQFVARFLARYVEVNQPQFKFKPISVLDPAVGSGIFLRTILEKKAETLGLGLIDQVKESFLHIKGVDINPTACDATKLSLTLLYLVLTDELPKNPFEIIEADALDVFTENDEKRDVVIANPPYVAYNNLSDIERQKLREFLGNLAYGRSDLYLPFIKIAIDNLKDGGLGLFVIPNTFMIMDSAKELRKYLIENTFIRCIVDLTEIQVFAENVYTILLIFEKVAPNERTEKGAYNAEPLATIAKVQDNVGEALYKLLSGNRLNNPYYAIYDVTQDFFKSEQWYLLPPTEHKLKMRLEEFPTIDSFFEIRTGFSSGASDVFIQHFQSIPKEERAIYIPFLDDRDVESYENLSGSDQYFFYPFEGTQQIDEERLQSKYPKTFSRLNRSKSKLSERKEVQDGRINWWYPSRPRSPKFMLVPKIVTPHLVYTPKFTVDFTGKFAVSRAPFLVLKEKWSKERDLLFYYTAVLNSSVCFWYLINHAPKYQKGYAMLEPKYLKSMPIPSHEEVDKIKLKKIIELVKERMESKKGKQIELDKRLERMVAELYGLSEDELKFLNID